MEPSNKSSANTARKWLWLLLAVAIIWFSNIEYRHLIRTDEGRYAEIPREMVTSGDWVTPRLNGLKYFEKPPLQYWATATAYTLFGEHHWTSRLWTSLTGFAGLLLVWFAGSRLFGREAGRYAALLLGSSMFYVLMGHFNSLDMGVTFFISLGIIALLLAQHQYTNAHTRRNWMWLAWIALGLAVLSKGLMGLVLPGAALVIYSLLQRDFAIWKRMHWGSGLLLLLLITAPWFYLVMKANPEFFHKFFIYEHYTRFTTTEHGRYQPWHYFIHILLLGFLPWTIVMLDTLARSWKNSTAADKTFNPQRFLLVWAVFIYVFFSMSGSKLPSYLLPVFPALALLMGKQIAEMNERRLFWLVAPVLPLAMLGLALAPFTQKLGGTPQRVQLLGDYAAWLTVAALVFLLGVTAAIFLLRHNRKPAAVLILALGSLLAAQIGSSGYNTIAAERSAYLLAGKLRPHVKESMPIYSVGNYEQTLTFYLKRTFILVQYQDEMAFGIMQEPQRWIPDLASFAKVWEAQPEAMAIILPPIFPQLQQLGLPMKIIHEDVQNVVVIKP